MKLNTEIIRQALEGEIPVRCSGRRDLSLHLGRPEYFLPGGRRFFAGHLYVARGEQLPQRPEIERGAALLCVGESTYLPYYLEDCCVLQAGERTDLCRLFNLLTAVYDRYDAWSQSLSHVLATSGSVREMISCSQEIFGNPLFVLNKEFHFLAQSSYSGIPLTAWEKDVSRQSGGDALDLPLLSTFLEHAELNTQKHGAMLINILDSSTLCVNLFQSGVYSGCLIVDYRRREHCPADDALAEHLAGQIELALARYTAPSGDERTSLRQTFQSLIEGLPADLEQQWLLECSQAGREYLCVKVRFGSRLAQLPIGYLCRMLEQSFPGSVAFPHDGAMVAFVETGSLEKPGKDPLQVLQERFALFNAGKDLRVGISDPFRDIYRAQLYYLQACAALDNGRLFNPGKRCCLFQDYALTELIVNALGKLPAEMYYSQGLRRLAEHDSSAPVSYIETLRAYLDRNMSITRTAAALYLNRSTLLERIGRIKRELGSDLQDPEERLRLQVLLKAMEIQAALQAGNQS